MINLSYLTKFFTKNIFSLTDIFEIFFISTIIYTLTLWLKKDQTKNLIIPFYSYFGCLFFSYYFNLAAINYIFFISFPILIIVFIILHQESLQKNFIMLNRNTNDRNKNQDWVEEFIKSCLLALNKKKEIIFVIEKKNCLANFLKTSSKFYADFNKELFDILIEKQISNYNYMVWINKEGKLVAINACWNFDIDEIWLAENVLYLENWKQKSIYITTKTDSFIVQIIPFTRTFNIIIQGKIIQNILPEKAFEIIRNNLFCNNEKKY